MAPLLRSLTGIGFGDGSVVAPFSNIFTFSAIFAELFFFTKFLRLTSRFWGADGRGPGLVCAFSEGIGCGVLIGEPTAKDDKVGLTVAFDTVTVVEIVLTLLFA